MTSLSERVINSRVRDEEARTVLYFSPFPAASWNLRHAAGTLSRTRRRVSSIATAAASLSLSLSLSSLFLGVDNHFSGEDPQTRAGPVREREKRERTRDEAPRPKWNDTEPNPVASRVTGRVRALFIAPLDLRSSFDGSPSSGLVCPAFAGGSPETGSANGIARCRSTRAVMTIPRILFPSAPPPSLLLDRPDEPSRRKLRIAHNKSPLSRASARQMGIR